MDKKDEALKMAIEDLSWALNCIDVTNWEDCVGMEEAVTKYKKARKTINACKEALTSNNEVQEPVNNTAERDYNFMRDLAIGTEEILNSLEPVATVAVDNFGNIAVGWTKKPKHNEVLYVLNEQAHGIGVK